MTLPSREEAMQSSNVPSSLRVWFIVHFIADLFFAIPLLIDPQWTLSLLGWSPDAVDPINARISASALMGIGVESWLSRDASKDVYRAMLSLKSIWSVCAWASVLWVMMSMPSENTPWGGWVIFVIFLSFSGIWNYYRIQLSQADSIRANTPS